MVQSFRRKIKRESNLTYVFQQFKDFNEIPLHYLLYSYMVNVNFIYLLILNKALFKR